MATTAESETLPTKDSVLKRDPMPVSEVTPKKVVLAKENSTEKTTEENQQKQSSNAMEIDLTEDVISPSNQT